MEGLRGSLGAGKEGGKQENSIALSQWTWCLEQRCSGCCRGHAAPLGDKGDGDAVPGVMLLLCISDPSLQAAMGLWHSLTLREEGVCVSTVFTSRWGFSSGPNHPAPLLHPLPRWVSEPESLLLCKSNWISSYWSLFCGPFGHHPCIHH